MKVGRAIQALGVLAALFGLVAGAAEAAGALWTSELVRTQVYAGGLAGLLLAAVGLPFVWKLSDVGNKLEASFWKWWGGGVLVRLVLLVGLALALAFTFHNRCAVPILVMGVMYLLGLLIETIWLARVLWKSDGTSARRAN